MRLLFSCLALLLAFALPPLPAQAADTLSATVYKSPWCGCCTGYVDHLKENGIEVTVKQVEDMNPVKQKYGVSDDLASCHTTLVGGYVVEGHVPLPSVYKLLKEKPKIRGIAAPGMPTGVPGMPGPKDPDPLLIYTLGPNPQVFDRQ